MSFCLSPGFSMADNARFQVYAVEERTAAPLAGKNIEGVFLERFQRWENATVDHEFEGETNGKGMYAAIGRTNCGEAVFRLHKNLGFYDTPRVKVPFDRAGGKPVPLFQWWKPDNQVVTVRLQRVEHPIPLCVKRVELRDYERGIGGFDGTNSVLRFDLMKGDWLPPYGKGEVADMRINSELKITDRERKFRYATKRVEDVLFYDLAHNIMFGNDDDFVQPFTADRTAGIKVRAAEDENFANVINRVRGMRKKIARNGNWNCEYFSDSVPDRCYTFRIRTRRNDKGELVEAYYGKIYGDFEFEGDDKKGLIGVKFLYYLNPKSLDRNLEWDMKTNLCPTAGKHESQQP